MASFDRTSYDLVSQVPSNGSIEMQNSNFIPEVSMKTESYTDNMVGGDPTADDERPCMDTEMEIAGEEAEEEEEKPKPVYENGSVIQISNISPGANLTQMVTLFSFIGKVEDVRFYPLDESMAYGSRICYIKYEDGACCGVAQHMTNTIFIDRALIVVPLPTHIIPDESVALEMLTTTNALSGSLQSGTVGLLAQQLPQIVGVNSLGMPQLASSLDPAKLEEIRRTIYIGNIANTVTAEQLLAFFSGVGEIKYVKMSGEDTAPIRSAYIEFSEITAIATALQYNGLILGGLPIKIMFSKTAIWKPLPEKKDSKKDTEKSSRSSSRRSRSKSPRRRSRSRSSSRRRSRRSRSRSSSRSRGSRRRHSRSRSRDRRRRRSRTRSRSKSPSSRSRSSRSSRGSRRRSRSRSRSTGRTRTKSRSRSPDDSRRRRDRDRRDRSRDRDSRRRSSSPSSRRKRNRSKERDSERRSSTGRSKGDTSDRDEDKLREDTATGDSITKNDNRDVKSDNPSKNRSPRSDAGSDDDGSRSQKNRKKQSSHSTDEDDEKMGD